MKRSLRLRTRWAVVTAVLVSLTGFVAVALITIVTQRQLKARSRQALQHGIGPAPQPQPGGKPASTPGGLNLQDGGRITNQVIHDVRVWGVWLVALLVLVAIVVAWLVAGRMLRPVRQVTETARSVTGAGDGRRIDLEGPADELKELADTIDSMLDRVDATYAAQRHFVADASHELRTPLAAMGLEVDVALDNPQADVEELRDALRGIRESLGRSHRLTESLLMLARAGTLDHVCDYDLAIAAQRAIGLTERVAPQSHFDANIAPAPTRGDPALLDRLAANLVENASRSGTALAPIAITTGTSGSHVFLTVSNDGAVIDATDVDGLFERFRRGDSSRSVASGGVGLGLSIVRQIVAAHNGTITALARPAGGLEINVQLPRAAG
ncbi:MAG TPA: ATP-binding protein [Ilumatobacteraceae bacterium]